jgi:hypothetical protein
MARLKHPKTYIAEGTISIPFRFEMVADDRGQVFRRLRRMADNGTLVMGESLRGSLDSNLDIRTK